WARAGGSRLLATGRRPAARCSRCARWMDGEWSRWRLICIRPAIGGRRCESDCAKQRNVAVGYGRRRRLTAGWRLAAVRTACGFLAVGGGLRRMRAADGVEKNAHEVDRWRCAPVPHTPVTGDPLLQTRN